MESARLLIIGAGVNGSAYATRLCNAGLNVTVLARGRRYESIQAQGIIVEDPFSRKRIVTRVPVINALRPDDIYDFVLVVVRKNQVGDLLPTLARNGSPNIVFLGNNLSGPQEFTRILDRRRIMLGNVIAGGKRDGDIIRAFISTPVASAFGEMDGSITPRLERLVRILRKGGIKAKASANMIDAQMTHAAGVALIGKLTMKHHCDLRSLSRSRADLALYVAASREAHRVLHACGHKVVPSSESVIAAMPAFLQIAGMRALLNSRLGEVGLAWHVSQAPDEVQQLADELSALADQVSFPVPAIRQVLA
jgi:2-dehydropantoate 2-reductase